MPPVAVPCGGSGCASVTDILDLLNAMYTFCAACCFAPFIGGLFWKGATAKGAIAILLWALSTLY